MKKRRLCGIILACLMCTATVTAAACTKEEQPPVNPPDDSTIITTDKKPSEITDAKDVAFAFMEKQSKFDSYQIDTTGTTVAKSLITYTQQIDNLTIKNGEEYFQQATSSSSLVKMQHQAFVSGDKVAYRNALTGDLLTATKVSYSDVYGITPDLTTLGGFVLNESTIRSASKVVGSALTYRFDLEVGDQTTAYMKKQMKEFGGLKSYPEFTSLRLTLALKDDWTPVSLTVEAEYDIDIAVLGKTSCTQKLESIYSDVNGEVSVPDEKAFIAAIGTAGTSEIVTPTPEQSDFMEIAQSFAELDYNTGIHFGAELEVGLLEENGLFTGPVDTQLYVKLNEDAGNVLNTINARWDINLSSAAPIFNFASMVGPMIPEGTVDFDLSILAKIYSVSLYYTGDGYLYAVVNRANVIIDDVTEEVTSIEDSGLPLIVEKINLAEALLPVITGGNLDKINDLDVDKLIGTLEDSFTVTQTETGKKFELKKEIVTALSKGYIGLIDNLIDAVSEAAGGGVIGDLAGGLIEGWLKASIRSLEIETITEDGAVTGISLTVKGVPASSDDKETINLLSFKLTVDGKIKDELDGDADKIAALLADEEVAANIRADIDKLTDEMWLGNSYISRLNKSEADYNALTESQKSLVINATIFDEDAYEEVSVFDYLKNLHDSLKKSADRFIELTQKIDSLTDAEWTELDELYEEISENETQLEYVGQEAIDAYLAAHEDRSAA